MNNPQYTDYCPYKLEPVLPNNIYSFDKLRIRNNPTNEAVGVNAGRCHHCGSNDLWSDQVVTGCNCCLAMLHSIIKVKFCSESEAVTIIPSKAMACISITNPGETAPLQKGWGKLLRISFADAEYDEQAIQFYQRLWMMSSNGVVTKKHALGIRLFIDGLDEQIEELVVHCGAGISRSAAVARYAAIRLGANLEGDSSKYNVTVARLLDHPYVFDHLLPKEKTSISSVLRKTVQRLFAVIRVGCQQKRKWKGCSTRRRGN